MFTGFASMLQGVGDLLLAASQSLPIYQLSLMAWAILAAGGALGSRSSFKTPEQSSLTLSKMSFQ